MDASHLLTTAHMKQSIETSQKPLRAYKPMLPRRKAASCAAMPRDLSSLEFILHGMPT